MTKKRFKSQFSIRKYNKARHPQIILEANKTKFHSTSLTHASKNRRKPNIPLKKNPDSSDKRKAYYQRRIIEDFKFRYSKAFNNYQLSNGDIDELIKFLESKKKRK